MCANKNKNIVKIKHTEIINNQLTECRHRIIEKIVLSIPVIGYATLFIVNSIFDTSVWFSMIVATLSSSVTIVFESLEWQQYHILISKKRYKFIDLMHPLSWVSLLWILTLIFIRIILNFYNLNIEEYPFIPNLVSAATLLFYFVSYVSRGILLEYHKYLSIKLKK